MTKTSTFVKRSGLKPICDILRDGQLFMEQHPEKFEYRKERSGKKPVVLYPWKNAHRGN